MPTTSIRNVATLLLIVLIGTAGNCTDSMLEPLAMNYRAEHDYGSLTGFAAYLRPGSHSRAYIEQLLGEGAATDIDGVVFYPSHETQSVNGVEHTKGLLVDYKNESGKVTGTLQAKELTSRPGTPSDYWPAE